MKKIVIFILAMSLALGMCLPVSANETNGLDGEEIASLISETEITLSPEDGPSATFVIYKSEDGVAVMEEYNPNVHARLTYSPGDGVLEYAVFHLGFKNWVEDTGDLYYTLTADELIKTVQGTAYVDYTSSLVGAFNDPFYEGSWYHTLSGTMNTTRAIKDDINVGDETSVKVGFKNVTITTIADRGGSFVNNSKTVTK